MTQSIESMIEVLQACKDGKKIQFRTASGDWESLSDPDWNFDSYEYRIAPEPKKKVTLQAWITIYGQLVWFDMSKVNNWSQGCIRVPSEDKEILL